MCLKLGDFGLAIDLHEERAVTRAGTLDYMVSPLSHALACQSASLPACLPVLPNLPGPQLSYAALPVLMMDTPSTLISFLS